MFNKILLAVDNSACAERAGRVALGFAKKLGSKLVVLHVIAPPAVPFGIGTPPEEQLRYAEELLEPWKKLTQQEGVSAQITHLYSNNTAEGIVFAANQHGCDLIVMGTHGREGLGRVLLGSVAERVSRTTKTPLLLVRGDGNVEPLLNSFSRILAPVDGSESGLPALKTADQLARVLGVELRLLAVVPYIPPMTYMDGTGFGSTAAYFNLEANEKAMLEEATAALEAAQRVVQAQGMESALVKAEGQSVAQAIIEYAHKNSCDLIVLGSHGRSGLDRLLLGSVAAGVSHHAGVPVLLVRHSSGVAPKEQG